MVNFCCLVLSSKATAFLSISIQITNIYLRRIPQLLQEERGARRCVSFRGGQAGASPAATQPRRLTLLPAAPGHGQPKHTRSCHWTLCGERRGLKDSPPPAQNSEKTSISFATKSKGFSLGSGSTRNQLRAPSPRTTTLRLSHSSP